MLKVKVRLQPYVTRLNVPTVLKTAILPGDTIERLFIATQVGEIYYRGNAEMRTFLDIRQRILELGTLEGGYDERGLLGLAFHPEFSSNGLFYLHYSLAGTQGPGALSGSFLPNPCDPATLNMNWVNRESQYDHIDTIEEWRYQPGYQPQMRRTLLNVRSPFSNHNGVNSLNFSPETGKLVLTIGDGGSGYDPFNLSQNNMEIAGKIIEIDVDKNTNIDNPPVVTRFDELPSSIQETLTVIAKGVRNMPGISYQRSNNQFTKLVGNVGQDLVESIFSFDQYVPVPVTKLIEAPSKLDQAGFINFGWRGWEGALPTSVIRVCSADQALNEKTIAYYNEAIQTSTRRLPPLTCYYHDDPRPDKFEGTAITGVQPYAGDGIPGLKDSIVFTDYARVRANESQTPARGALAYTRVGTDCKPSDFSVIDIDYDFGSESAFFVSFGTNIDQTELYLGVYGSTNVTNLNQGTVYRILP